MNGKSALEALSDLPQETSSHLEETDLILLDINMPILDGFGFLKGFPELDHQLTKQAKVVILTSSMNLEDKKRSSASPYVVGYLNKPLTEEKLAELAEI